MAGKLDQIDIRTAVLVFYATCTDDGCITALARMKMAATSMEIQNTNVASRKMRVESLKAHDILQRNL